MHYGLPSYVVTYYSVSAESSRDYYSNKGYEYPRKPDMHILPDSLFFFEEDEKLNKQAKSKKTSK